MQIIETKYFGATNYKGERIRVKTSGGFTKWFSWDYALNSSANHMKAAKAVKDLLDLPGKMHGGDTQTGMVFVWDNDYTIG